MERIFSKREEQLSSEHLYAHQLITVADLKAFKNQLIDELLTALKSQTNQLQKKWLKSHEVRRMLKISPAHCKPLNQMVLFPTLKSREFISLITKTFNMCSNQEK